MLTTMDRLLTPDRHIDAIRIMTADRNFDWPVFSGEVAVLWLLIFGADPESEFDESGLEAARLYIGEYLAAEAVAGLSQTSGDMRKTPA